MERITERAWQLMLATLAAVLVSDTAYHVTRATAPNLKDPITQDALHNLELLDGALVLAFVLAGLWVIAQLFAALPTAWRGATLVGAAAIAVATVLAWLDATTPALELVVVAAISALLAGVPAALRWLRANVAATSGLLGTPGVRLSVGVAVVAVGVLLYVIGAVSVAAATVALGVAIFNSWLADRQGTAQP